MDPPAIHDYQLLDFGQGRKLERFGPWTVDRPCPAANELKRSPQIWKTATARFEGSRAADGTWKPVTKKWASQKLEIDVLLDDALGFKMLLSPLPSGQVGIFPEQLPNWSWIVQQTQRTRKQLPDKPVKILNLFAYTGGSTLAAAVARAEVTHVDAAKSVVTRARENAAASGLADHPIRWIVEDAVKFCRRELKRGNQYDAVILDPPSYGHGPKGEAWSISRDLLPLLKLVRELTSERRAFILTTCHTPSIGPAELDAMLAEGVFGRCGQGGKTGKLFLEAATGTKLESGVYARWPN